MNETPRPARIGRPLGHDPVLAHLERLACRDQPSGPGAATPIPHALLMIGPEGVGKFGAATWWTAQLKCDAPVSQNDSPACAGTCPSCKQVASGSHPDVHVVEPIEAGKQISIDAIRNLIRMMSFKPIRRGPRVAIVRDAHLLGVHAQSAMLKLLEEPPGFAVIVLVADNLSALLPTIRSRCQTLRFGPLDARAVQELLVAAGRDPELARQAAARARGRAGRALSWTTETLADRTELLVAFESFRDGTASDMEGLVAELVERTSKGRPGLEALLEWEVEKLETSVGYRAQGESDRLGEILAGVAEADVGAIVASAARIQSTIRALARNANARLAIRDMLIDIRPS